VNAVTDLMHIFDADACERLKRLALYDSVTQLPNRHYLNDLLEAKLLFAEENNRYLALLLIAFDDLDRFNQMQGAGTDEKIIRTLAEKTRSVLGDEDILAQVESDKFVVVHTLESRHETAELLAQRLLHLYSETISIDGHLFYIGASIGVALFPTDAQDARGLYTQARILMRQARTQGANHYRMLHEADEEGPCETIAGLSRDLPVALERGDIYFEVQPQYSPQRGRFVGAELLARWRHPVRGMVSPGVFLPLAEQSGMIRILTMNAVMEASRIFKKLDAAGIEGFSLSINLPPNILFNRDFLENVAFFIEHYDLAGRRLGFEITENILTQNVEGMARQLDALREMGIRIEIDDYGTGYTSLKYLASLPVDTLKIDRDFVQGIHEDTRRFAVFQAIVDMSRALGFEVIAEGVEVPEEAATVTSLGDVVMQGFHFARPMKVDAMVEMLSQTSESSVSSRESAAG
jgi:diguanylate cyclase (GGDEF)-like protein